MTRISIGGRPVTYAFTVVYGADPSKLPTPGDPPVFGVEAPHSALEGRRYMLEDGSVWEYRGVGAYDADNWSRICGWERVDGPMPDGAFEEGRKRCARAKAQRARFTAPAPELSEQERLHETAQLLERMHRAASSLMGRPIVRRAPEQLALRFGT